MKYIEHWLLKSNFGYFWQPQSTFKKVKQKVTFGWLCTATVGSKSDVTLYQGNRIRVKHNEHKSCRRLLKTVLQVETCFVTRRPAEWFR